MKKLILLVLVLCAGAVRAQDDLSKQLLIIKRIYVDRLTGGETAAQMRDLIIASLHGAKLYVMTENQERADAILRGAAEDLIYTDQFQSSDSVDLRSGVSSGSRSGRTYSGSRSASISVGVGDKDSTDIRERKHEALATVRLVNKDGDVIWSTTQESTGGKFRGASADVADRIARQLTADLDRVKKTVR
jgi:chaperonin GroEL (HSP60 family)